MAFDLSQMKWRCHVCGDMRPDAKISVHTVDRSWEHGLSVGVMQQNIRYCNDRLACRQGAIEKGKKPMTEP